MSITTKLYTAEDLFALGSDARFELIDGELHDVPGSGLRSSVLGGHIFLEFGLYLRANPIGVVSGEDGGYILQRSPDRVVSPDVGFIRKDRLPDGKAPDFFSQVPPDLAVEIMSPTDRLIDAERKVQRFLDAGVPLIWLVKPNSESVVVYGAGKEQREIGIGDVLSGDEVLPGFSLPIAEIFAGHR